MHGRPPVNTDVLAQLRQLGAPEDVIDATRQRLVAEAEAWCVHVWPENWHAVQLFVAMGTQWTSVATLAGVHRTGLRYEAIPAVRAMVAARVPKRWRQPMDLLMRQLQHLEDEALAAWAQQRRSAP